jgi:hypothetical protein
VCCHREWMGWVVVAALARLHMCHALLCHCSCMGTVLCGFAAAHGSEQGMGSEPSLPPTHPPTSVHDCAALLAHGYSCCRWRRPASLPVWCALLFSLRRYVGCQGAGSCPACCPAKWRSWRMGGRARRQTELLHQTLVQDGNSSSRRVTSSHWRRSTISQV